MSNDNWRVEPLGAEQAEDALEELVKLLQDGVNSGASLGFWPPLRADDAISYWLKIIKEIAEEKRLLLVARQDEQIIGTVQLEFATKTNAQHRAEIQKLIVHRRYRGQGLGQLLLNAVEEAAREAGRTLLILDTRTGDSAERLYRRHGYIEIGSIPGHTCNETGTFEDTVFFYRQL